MSLKIVDGEVSYYDIIPTRTNLPKHDLAPLEFFIQGHDNSLINSRDIQLSITFYISGKKGTVDPDFKKLPQDHHLVPINGFLYTMFEEVEVYFNNALTDHTWRMYQYLVYKNLLFNTSQAEKDYTLKSSLWAMEQGQWFENIQFIDNMEKEAPGVDFRVQKVNKSQHCDCKGRLRIECLDVENYILANTDILIRMFPHQPQFCLWSDHNDYSYRITIVRAQLQVPRIFPKQASLLKMHQALYHFRKTTVQMFPHAQQIQDFGPQVIASGVVPKKIFVAISTEKRNLGAYKLNRFNMKDWNAENVLIRYQSAEFPSRQGYTMAYEAESPHFVDAWYGMYLELGQLENPKANITWDQFRRGYCFYVFNLEKRTLDPQPTGYSALATGTTELSIRFRTAPTQNLAILVWQEFDFQWELTKNGAVVIDSTVSKKRKKTTVT